MTKVLIILAHVDTCLHVHLYLPCQLYHGIPKLERTDLIADIERTNTFNTILHSIYLLNADRAMMMLIVHD